MDDLVDKKDLLKNLSDQPFIKDWLAEIEVPRQIKICEGYRTQQSLSSEFLFCSFEEIEILNIQIIDSLYDVTSQIINFIQSGRRKRKFSFTRA